MRTSTRDRIMVILWIIFAIGYALFIVNIPYSRVWLAWLCITTVAFVPFCLALVIAYRLEDFADNQKSKRKTKMTEFLKVQHYNLVKNGLNHFDYTARLAETERIIAEEDRLTLVKNLNSSIESHKTVIHNAESSIKEIEVVLAKLGEIIK